MKERSFHLELSEKHYSPEKVEQAVYDMWLRADCFTADVSSQKPPYSIVIPPPNVTGRLHMGHALNNTLQDVLCRYKRMCGFDVLWVPGTDHAGISTQSVVKKHLDAEGIDYRSLGREQVIERIWKWKEKYGDQILLQLRRLGASCDWTRTRFTMDDGLSRAVRTLFKRFYDEDLIYRGKYIVNWCPVDRTALSDDEVETKDGGEPGHLWHFRYPFSDGSGYVEIATTRPETMFGDTAIAVNPKDERFQALVGRSVTLPLVGREIPIIADDYVDPEFGTGCVKITPAHDPNDFQLGLRHNLLQVNVMNEDATMNDEVPEEFRGLDRYVARKRVVAAMEKQGLLVQIEDRNIPVGRSYRSKAVIEYRLSDQWFVRMRPLAERALEASQAGKVTFYPERWDSFYQSWLGKIRDWCISRQIWWGHRIPAWYHVDTGEILVDVETPERVSAEPEKWVQDEDVLDTWFSSALWPYSTLGWPEETPELKRYYPTSVLVTAKDIIFFWVARMVMTGLYNLNEVPFHKVLINSIITDEDGETMSKSKGNGIDPLHVIDGATREDLEGPVREARPTNMETILKRVSERFPDGFSGVGADAMRYTLLTSATDAQQVGVSFKRFDEVGRPLTNKLWNASKLALSMLEDSDGVSPAEPELSDRWILARLDLCTRRVRDAFDTYGIHHAADGLYHFFWDDICDWYLEIAKLRRKTGTEAEKARIALTLSEVFLGYLRLLHPIMPFITEELWGRFFDCASQKNLFSFAKELKDHPLCIRAPFPEDQRRHEEISLEEFELFQDIVRSVRNMRAKANVSFKTALSLQLLTGNPEVEGQIRSMKDLLCQMLNLSACDFVQSRPEGNAVTVLPKVEVFANLFDFIDVEAERKRTEGSLQKLEKQIAGLEQKLANQQFVSGAPKSVVDAEREKLQMALETREKLRDALGELKSLN
ncbi:MAG: valine--tRNA ligase [Bdellovibrionales bacterium]|nr:valine--tRNA ligase [Bdellovibrionales bacterium]